MTTSANPNTSRYTRAAPSPRYQQLVAHYRSMHLEGEQSTGLPAEETFDGRSLAPQAWKVRILIDHHQAHSILDYGAGKAGQYAMSPFTLPDGSSFADLQTYWGVERVSFYDAGYLPFSGLPTAKSDGVISTDVLEHCPEEDMRWIVDEMFGFAEKFVFASIASYPAGKHLPDGQNAHCTIQTPDWWENLFREIGARHPLVRWYIVVETREPVGDGRFRALEHMRKG